MYYATEHHSEAAIPRRLMESIYEFLYDQSVKEVNPAKWRFQVKYHTQILNCDATSDGRTRISFQERDNTATRSDAGDYDLVISATGYERDEHKRILSPLRAIIDGPNITVGVDYQVNFRSGLKRKDTGIWVLHSLATTEDVSKLRARLAKALTKTFRLMIQFIGFLPDAALAWRSHYWRNEN